MSQLICNELVGFFVSLDVPPVFEFGDLNETDDWMFLSSIEMAYDFRKNEGLRQTNYGVEKASGEIFELTFVHPDYEGKEYSPTALNVRYYLSGELITVLEEGKLKGKLKEIASTLDEEDNGVIMLLKRK